MVNGKLTEEQKRIVRALEDFDKFIVNAFAGTGKTHTLKAIAETYPRLKFLILVYNRSVKEELLEKLPSNCQIYTVHALAYKHFDRKERIANEHELVSKIIDLLELKSKSGYAYGFFLKDLLLAYFDSYETEINRETLTKIARKHSELRRKLNIVKRYGLANMDKIKDDLEYLIYAISKGELPLVHGYYLKVFQLNLEQYQDYFSAFDVLMVDEGQDMNGVQLQIIEQAKVGKKIICGDKHQSIYSWRGAHNALGKLKDWPSFYLTKSFRFKSEEPIELANAFLRNWKNEQAQMVMGRSQAKTGLTAYISRTSAGLLEFVHSLDKKVRFTRDIEDIFRTAKIGSKIVEYYTTGKSEFLIGVPYHIKLLIESGEVKSAEELAEKLTYDIGDFEYGYAIYLALKYDINFLYRKAIRMNSLDAKTVLSTAHSAKGLQFDKVNFNSDFPEFGALLKAQVRDVYGEKKNIEKEDIQKVINCIYECSEECGDLLDELNLQYVAVTRAIKELGTESEALRKNLTSKPDPDKLCKKYNQKSEDALVKKLISGSG